MNLFCLSEFAASTKSNLIVALPDSMPTFKETSIIIEQEEGTEKHTLVSSAAESSLNFVPFPGFYEVQTTATESALRDAILDEEPCLTFDLDQHTVKSSHPCHTTPFALKNASISTLVTDAESNNGPLDSSVSIPSKTFGPYNPLVMSCDWQGSSVGHCQSGFMSRGHSLALANCDVDPVPSWGLKKRDHGIKIETSTLPKRTLPYNNPGINSFASRTSLRKSGQQETSVQNYMAGMYSFYYFLIIAKCLN
jgi:hypothetical protein